MALERGNCQTAVMGSTAASLTSGSYHQEMPLQSSKSFFWTCGQIYSLGKIEYDSANFTRLPAESLVQREGHAWAVSCCLPWWLVRVSWGARALLWSWTVFESHLMVGLRVCVCVCINIFHLFNVCVCVYPNHSPSKVSSIYINKKN